MTETIPGPPARFRFGQAIKRQSARAPVPTGPDPPPGGWVGGCARMNGTPSCWVHGACGS